jgi:hypothetical protein
VNFSQKDQIHPEKKDIPVVDTPLASFMIHIKVLQVIVKVDAARAQVPAQQGGVGGKDGRHVDMPLAAQGDREAGLPFVEVGNDGRVGLARAKLARISCILMDARCMKVWREKKMQEGR